jgi:uncharacterized protein (DUF488 family)
MAAWTEPSIMTDRLFTIGHSNHPLERFLDLLDLHHITAVADVRSSPYSRHNPQFNREPLQQSLKRAGVTYVYLGAELGARCAGPACVQDGKVRFSLVARTWNFQHGLDKVRTIMNTHNLVLMCAEKDPLQCHRTMLVCRNLRKETFSIEHILTDGSIETQSVLEDRLLKLAKVEQEDLFFGREDLIERAYDSLTEKNF